jgi:AraC-like DNA-binding protein
MLPNDEPVSLRRIRRGATNTPYPAPWHTHRAFEVEVLLQGRQECQWRGGSAILVPGDLALTPGWAPHAVRPLSRAAESIAIHFSPAFLGSERVGETPWFAVFRGSPDTRPRLCRSAARQHALRVVSGLAEEAGRQGPGSALWRSAVRLGVLRLLLAAAGEWQLSPDDRRIGGSAYGLDPIVPALELVTALGTSRVSVLEAAAACSLSRAQFHVVFRERMGMSFHAFVVSSRLNAAIQLMLTTHGTLREIAREAGFSDASHLHRLFVKHCGCTPASYRAQAGSCGRGRSPARRAADAGASGCME